MSQYITHKHGGCGCKGCGRGRRCGSDIGGGPRGGLGDSGDGLSGLLDGGSGFVLIGVAALAAYVLFGRGSRR